MDVHVWIISFFKFYETIFKDKVNATEPLSIVNWLISEFKSFVYNLSFKLDKI